MILGIDPGNCTGWAILTNSGQLLECGINEPPFRSDYSLVVIECPQVYPGTTAKRANDLIKVAVGVGRYSHQFRMCKQLVVLPHEWKGSVPKEIHNARTLKSLTPEELERVPKMAKTKLHNLVDGVGLAKYGYRKFTVSYR